jgi:pyrimidine-nucleoside phosphorylase
MFSMYDIISKKRDGNILSDEEIRYFIGAYVKGDIPDYQMSALLMAVYIRGLNTGELSTLTETMMNSGDTIPLSGVGGVNIDKHSTGGVGDKLSLILAPMVACCGVNVPMLSGRGLGHTGGTLDKLESIPGFNVFLDMEKFRTTLRDTGMVICGQTDNIVPADKKLYALRDATATVSCIPLIASSIMSKKLALGSDGIVMDIKTGNGAFMKDEKDAIELAKTMISIGENRGRKVVALVTDMSKPLGKYVGNALEVVESIEALKGNGDADMMEVTYALGSQMLILAGKEKDYHEGINRLKKSVDSGEALDRFRLFVGAQGGDERICDDTGLLPQSKIREEFVSDKSGYISRIDSYEIGMAAIDIGAGRRKKEDVIDHSAGFVFKKNTGDHVEKGEPILIIHANDKGMIEGVKMKIGRAVGITETKPVKEKMIRYYIDKNGLKDWNP